MPMYLLAPFIVQNFKKVLKADPKLPERTIVRCKMAHLTQKIFFFFRKPISKPCRVHSRLSTSKKSESDVNPLTRCWRLKNTEIWLAESIFGHNLTASFFSHIWFSQNASES